MRFALKQEENFDLRENFLPILAREKIDALFLCNPNNPTGRLIADDLLEEILRICREKNIALFVDECFLSLSDGGVDLTPSLSDVPQLFILKAFTKSFGMAGLRLGYGLSADEALLRKMSAAVPPWNVSTLAQAAGIEPDVRMNPILLKPTTDVGSQVIVNGRVQGNMPAMEYYRRKRDFIPAVMEAYESLAREYDIIVIEGAGSPAEINLQENDIVNMGLARMVDAPVLLVGDIDRGGVFAQLYGTVALQSEEDRRRIKGVVVNKFRGDRAILEPGLKTLEELCGVPVAGVVPYLHVDIDDEDSLSERFGRDKEPRLIDIAVIRLPRISNFTDFSPFERYENVSLRYVERARDLRAPDMIVIPGTKSTIADLQWLRQSGLEASIQKAASGGTLVFGVCGGYQMLGRHISDPEQVEAAGVTEIDGMGLLPLETVFQGEKVQTQTKGVFSGVAGLLSELNGKRYAGYEIHMGRSEEARGALFSMGNVYGSYVHGIFDEQEVADTILKALCTKKGVSFESLGTFDARAYKERQYDLLADAVRAGLDMPLIYRILNREV